MLFLLLLSIVFGCASAADNWGLQSDCPGAAIPQSTFTSVYAGRCKSFYGVYYKASAVSNPNTYTGIAAGVNQNCVNSLVNSKKAGNDGVFRDNDAIAIPKRTASAPISGWNVCTLSGYSNNILCQAYAPIYAVNKAVGGGQLCVTRVEVWVSTDPAFGSNWGTQAENEAFLTKYLSFFKPLGGPGPVVAIMTTSSDWSTVVSSSYVAKDGENNPVQLIWSDTTTGSNDYTGFSTFGQWSPPTSPIKHFYKSSFTPACDVTGLTGGEYWFPT